MSNCEAVDLPVVEAGLHQLREVLRCLIHTIVFNRSLGYVKPKDVDSELFDVTYVACEDAGLEAAVEARISELCTTLERRPAASAQVRVGFYQTRKKAAWFGSKDERLYWEQWFINLSIVSPELIERDAYATRRTSSGGGGIGGDGASPLHVRAEAGLSAAQAEVVRFVNERRDHIPPVASASAVTFPFDITMSGGSKTAFEAKLHEVKKMVLQAAPPPML
ncbi:hypothetical protein FOA52_006130 [Chlamydomonas sp. UWO 241]|nr:hypothetical protein FOA52_006130 [Chlamydomonas sp. UWO 241]